MIYQWKHGARIKVDAQIVGEALETLRGQRAGLLTPPDVVIAGRPESSPLHACFEWDDTLAANAYRIVQAGDVLRSIVVSVERPGHETPAIIRAFVSVNDDESRHPAYTSMKDAMADPAMREYVLGQAKRELRQWRERYRYLQEMADLFGAIDETLVAA